MKNRLVSIILTLSILLSLMPATVAAEKTGPTIVIDDLRVVADGTRTGESMPSGVSYSGNTLTLDNASLETLQIRHGSVIIALKGHSTIRNDGKFLDPNGEVLSPVMIGSDDHTTVTIKGPGSLMVDSSGTDAMRTFVADYTGLSITDEANVTVRTDHYGHGTMELVSSSLTMNGGASLTVDGTTGIWFGVDHLNRGPSVHHFTDCTVNTSHLVINSQRDGVSSNVTVGEGAVFNLSASASETPGTMGRVIDLINGSQFLLDGGEINITTANAPDGTCSSVLLEDDGSFFELRRGLLNMDITGNHSLVVKDNAEFLQTGGTLNIHSRGTRSGCALRLQNAFASLRGGTANLTGRCGVALNGNANNASVLTINGSKTQITGTEEFGVTLSPGSQFAVLDGEVSIQSQGNSAPELSVPILCEPGSHLFFWGGKVDLDTQKANIVTRADDGQSILLGGDMRAVDNATGREIPSGQIQTSIPGSSVTISGGKSYGTYAFNMRITSGEVTQGARFSVRADVSLGADNGEVSFVLPSGVSYVPDSLTVDNHTVTPTSTNPLTIPVQQGGTIRFSATAGNTGTQTLVANVTTAGKLHRETLDFTVSSFNLSLPSCTARLTLPVSGAAIPGSTITICEEDRVLGESVSNELGTWSGTIILPDVIGEHTVHAVVNAKDGSSFRSDDYIVLYDPNLDEVKTLTVTNHVHGRTNADPALEETLIIDFITGEDTSSYYTYWPDLPKFEFKVDFVKDASAQSKVSVVTTNRMGEETEVPLQYNAAEDTWFGAYSYDEDNTPRKFRVEYVSGGADESSATYLYNENGSLTEIRFSDGKSIDLSYANNQPIQLTMNGVPMVKNDVMFYLEDSGADTSQISELEYDVLGRVTKLTTPDGAYYTFAYDSTKRPVAGLAGGTTEVLYYDGNGNVTQFCADPTNNSGYLAQLTQSNGDTTSYTCDQFGNITGVTDSGGTTTEYVRDEQGNLTAIRYPDGKSETYAYDENGQIILSTSRSGATISYAYDADGNLTRKTLSSGASVSYSYDSASNLISITENGQTTKMAYDGSGNLTKVTYPDGTYVAYAYDSENRRTLLTDSGGYQTGYTYHSNGLLSTVTDGTDTKISYSYDANGKITRQENANGTYSLYTYAGENLSSIRNYDAQGSLFSSFVYSYDREGRVNTMTDVDGSWLYRYDALGQLTQAISPDGSITAYTYDASGNHVQTTANDQTTRYSTNELGQYTSYGAITCTYDTDGNLLTETKDGKTARYTWDPFGRLVSYTDFDGSTYEYGYDAFGLRNRVTVNGVTTTYLNDPTGDGMPVASYAPDSETHYILAGGLAALQTGGDTYYYHANRLGCVTELTNGIGEAVNRYTYDHEGNILTRTEGIPNPYTYAGIFGLIVDGNGLIYDRARYISTQTDSFISIDPTGQTYDLNLYRYVYNDPVNHVDSNGESGITINIGGLNIGLGNQNRGQSDSQQNPYIQTKDPNDNNNNNNNDGNNLRPPRPPTSKHFDYDAMVAGSLDALKWICITIAVVAAIAAIIYFWPVIAPTLPTLLPALGAPALRLVPVLARGVPLTLPLLGAPVIAAEPERTADKPKYMIEDPSGYVYEGIPSNRLSGVTTTLYFSNSKNKPTQNAQENQKWDAAAFDQRNPLSTDTGGQYLWMVPDGWWQVKYEKAGYETRYSDWLPVPPVQTEVNAGLTSKAAAKLTLDTASDGTLLLRFDRPVCLSSVTAKTLSVQCNNAPLNGTFTPVDPALSDNAQICATTFRFSPGGGTDFKAGDDLTAQFQNVTTYAGTGSSGKATLSVTVSAPTFTDVKQKDWFYSFVSKVCGAGWMTGKGDGIFDPNGNLSLAEVMVLASRLHADHTNKEIPTVNGAWYMTYYSYCKNQGLLTGMSLAEKDLNRAATRYEMVAILDRAARKDQTSGGVNTVNNGFIPDVKETDPYGEVVYRWYRSGIVTGDSNHSFNGPKNITRAEVSVILCQLLELVNRAKI